MTSVACLSCKMSVCIHAHLATAAFHVKKAVAKTDKETEKQPRRLFDGKMPTSYICYDSVDLL